MTKLNTNNVNVKSVVLCTLRLASTICSCLTALSVYLVYQKLKNVQGHTHHVPWHSPILWADHSFLRQRKKGIEKVFTKDNNKKGISYLTIKKVMRSEIWKVISYKLLTPNSSVHFIIVNEPGSQSFWVWLIIYFQLID